MADFAIRTAAPLPYGVYMDAFGGVMQTSPLDMSGGVDGNWTVAQFDAMGNLRVTATGGLWNGFTEEPQKADGAGSGAALTADKTTQLLLKGILHELIQLRKQHAAGQTSAYVDYESPLFDLDKLNV